MEMLTVTLPGLSDRQAKALLQWMHEEGVYSVNTLVYKVVLEELARRMGPDCGQSRSGVA